MQEGKWGVLVLFCEPEPGAEVRCLSLALSSAVKAMGQGSQGESAGKLRPWVVSGIAKSHRAASSATYPFCSLSHGKEHFSSYRSAQ